MNNEIPLEIKLAFAASLEHTFSTDSQASERDGLPITTNSLSNGEIVSTDQWAGDKPRTTGGQEIVNAGPITYTRVYAGGVINDKEKLAAHEITEHDVIDFLIEVISKHSGKIRLDEPFELAVDSWTYSYIPSCNTDIPMWSGVELIYHMSGRGDDDVVFQHNFTICPVES